MPTCPGERLRDDVFGEGSRGEGHGSQAVPAASRLLCGGGELPPEHRPLLRDRSHHAICKSTLRARLPKACILTL